MHDSQLAGIILGDKAADAVQWITSASLRAGTTATTDGQAFRLGEAGWVSRSRSSQKP